MSITLNSSALHSFGLVPIVLTQSPPHNLESKTSLSFSSAGSSSLVPAPGHASMIPKLEVAKITKASDLRRIVQQYDLGDEAIRDTENKAIILIHKVRGIVSKYASNEDGSITKCWHTLSIAVRAQMISKLNEISPWLRNIEDDWATARLLSQNCNQRVSNSQRKGKTAINKDTLASVTISSSEGEPERPQDIMAPAKVCITLCNISQEVQLLIGTTKTLICRVCQDEKLSEQFQSIRHINTTLRICRLCQSAQNQVTSTDDSTSVLGKRARKALAKKDDNNEVADLVAQQKATKKAKKEDNKIHRTQSQQAKKDLDDRLG